MVAESQQYSCVSGHLKTDAYTDKASNQNGQRETGNAERVYSENTSASKV